MSKRVEFRAPASALQLLELLPVPAVLVAADWTMLDWNGAATELFGRRAPMTPGAHLGRALGCGYAGDRGLDCGRAEACEGCAARSMSIDVLADAELRLHRELTIPAETGGERHFRLAASGVPLPTGPAALLTFVEVEPPPPPIERASSSVATHLEALLAMQSLESTDGGDALGLALELAVDATSSSIGYLHLVAVDGQHLTLHAWSSQARALCEAKPVLHYPVSEAGIWAESLRQGRPVIHNDYPDLGRHDRLPEGHAPLRRHMSIPVRCGDRVVAILGVGNRSEPYSYADAQLLELLGAGLWAVVQGKRSAQRLEDTVLRLRRLLGGTVEAITRSVEMGDPATAGHQRRVSDLARAIATELGLPPRHVDAIRLTAMLHDIGKLAVPSDIVTKPGRLSRAEMALVRQHAAIGAEILAPISFPERISEIVEQHHERLDGSGYPKRLEGDAICIEARILAVADIVEAMLSHRPYRPAHSLEQTLWEIRQQRGRQLDSGAVDACLRLFEERDYRFPEEREA
jgi:putative nucleotidyltransferase with HDIG domain